MEPQNESLGTWNATIDRSGRVLLPAELRHAIGASHGSALVWIKDEQGLHLKSFDDSIAEMQAYYKSLSPLDDVWSESILEQRRAEAKHD